MAEGTRTLTSETTVSPQTSSEVTSVSLTTGAPTWLHLHIQNLILLIVLGMVVYLAYVGSTEARMALVQTFISLVSYVFGTRAALKRPGQDS